jgi:hypothetical protein
MFRYNSFLAQDYHVATFPVVKKLSNDNQHFRPAYPYRVGIKNGRVMKLSPLVFGNPATRPEVVELAKESVVETLVEDQLPLPMSKCVPEGAISVSGDTTSVNKNRSVAVVCPYFTGVKRGFKGMRGCRFGDRCRNLHL